MDYLQESMLSRFCVKHLAWSGQGAIGDPEEVQQMINRINELAHKKKSVGLTEEELAEQKSLYKLYIAAFRANLKSQLDMIEIVDEDSEK